MKVHRFAVKLYRSPVQARRICNARFSAADGESLRRVILRAHCQPLLGQINVAYSRWYG